MRSVRAEEAVSEMVEAGDEIRCGGARRGKIGGRHNRTALWRSVGVLCARGEKLLLGFWVRRLMGLRDGNVANARCWGINPLRGSTTPMMG